MRRTVLLVVTVVALLTGCSAVERVCSEGERPAMLLQGGQLMGGECVAEGEQPSPGFLCYPGDLEPTMLRDQEQAQRAWQERLNAQRQSQALCRRPRVRQEPISHRHVTKCRPRCVVCG